MARGWHYTKLSLASALLLSFYGMCFVLLFAPSFLSLLFCFVMFFILLFILLSLELCTCPLIFFCPADHVPDWQPRIILLGTVEARSVNVKKTATITTTRG